MKNYKVALIVHGGLPVKAVALVSACCTMEIWRNTPTHYVLNLEVYGMEESTVKNEQGKKKHACWLKFCLITFLAILIFFPFLLKFYSCFPNISLHIQLCFLFISLCWVSAFFTFVITSFLFVDGISRSNLHIIRILGQSAMLMVITGLILILLVSFKVLFL